MTAWKDIQDSGARLDEEEQELRQVDPTDGALGKNASDYRLMFDIFSKLTGDIKVLRSDPNAFLTSTGQWNEKILGAYSKLYSLAIKSLSELNKMRNADKMTSAILDDHARELSQAVVVELSMEMRALITEVDQGIPRDEIVMKLKRLLYRRLPEILLKSATTTLSTTKEQYSLLN